MAFLKSKPLTIIIFVGLVAISAAGGVLTGARLADSRGAGVLPPEPIPAATRPAESKRQADIPDVHTMVAAPVEGQQVAQVPSSPAEPVANLVYCKVPVANVRRSPTTAAERVTQTLFGHPLRKVGQRGDWIEVRVIPQCDYPGWIKATLVLTDAQAVQIEQWCVIANACVEPVSAPDSAKVADGWPDILYGGSLVGSVREAGDWTQVTGVNGRTAWLPSNSMMDLSRQPLAVDIGAEIAERAKQYIGSPYLWGGVTCKGLDCSGLVWASYFACVLKVPRDAGPQYQAAEHLDKPSIPGADCVFFQTYKPGASHVGIYLGNNRFIQSTGNRGVHIEDLDAPYYAKRFIGAGRPADDNALIVHISINRGKMAPLNSR